MIFFNDKKTHAVVISPWSIIFTIFALFVVYFFYQVRFILTLLFLSFIIMTALNPWVSFLTRKFKVPRTISIVIVYFLVMAFFTGLIGLMIPPLGSQLIQLVKAINFPYFQEEIKKLTFGVSELSALASQVGNSVGILFTIISSTFAGLFTFFTLVVMSLYLTIDRPDLYKKIAWFSSDKEHMHIAKEFIDDLEIQLGGWVRGQVLLMLLIGFLTFLGLFLLNIPYALPLALLAGLLEIVPNLGPTIAAVPAVIFGYVTGGPVLAGVLLLFYIVVQQVENNIVVPKIMQESADVNPLISIVVILMGFEVGGVIGALLGIPIYIMFRSAYSLVRKHRFFQF